jgi:alanine racemase
MRPILASISLSALAHNLGVARARAKHSRIFAVIKANGYGHGLLNVADGLKDADGFAILSIDEATKLREAGYLHPILLLEGVFSSDEWLQVSQLHLTAVVHSFKQIDSLERTPLKHPLSVFLKMNTGMNRLGFRPEEVQEVINRLSHLPMVKDIVLMTHFATADDSRGIDQQMGVFKAISQKLPYKTSLANSAAILRHPTSHGDWVRAGIMLYGSSPFEDETASSMGLKPVMRLTSKIIATQTLNPGESAGYGFQFTANKTTRIGVVACGYADGYPRHAPNGTPVAVNGIRTQIIGRVSMDMLFVDITSIPEADIDSEVELWGNLISIDEVAKSSGTIGYELMCAISSRVSMQVV